MSFYYQGTFEQFMMEFLLWFEVIVFFIFNIFEIIINECRG